MTPDTNIDERIDKLVHLLHAKHREGECLKVQSAKTQIKQLITEARIDEQSRTMIIDECLVFDAGKEHEPFGQPQAERLAALQGEGDG